MIITTTNNIESYGIVEYVDTVFREFITGVDFVKDFSTAIRDFFVDVIVHTKKN